MLFTETYLTNAGLALFARSSAGEGPIVWGESFTGDMDIGAASMIDLVSMTAVELGNKSSVGAVKSSIVDTIENTATLHCELTNGSGGDAYNLGIMAKVDGDGGEVLAIVARPGVGVSSVFIHSNATGVIKILIDIAINIGNTSALTVVLNPSGYAQADALALTNVIVEKLQQSVQQILKSYASSFRSALHACAYARDGEVFSILHDAPFVLDISYDLIGYEFILADICGPYASFVYEDGNFKTVWVADVRRLIDGKPGAIVYSGAPNENGGSDLFKSKAIDATEFYGIMSIPSMGFTVTNIKTGVVGHDAGATFVALTPWGPIFTCEGLAYLATVFDFSNTGAIISECEQLTFIPSTSYSYYGHFLMGGTPHFVMASYHPLVEQRRLFARAGDSSCPWVSHEIVLPSGTNMQRLLFVDGMALWRDGNRAFVLDVTFSQTVDPPAIEVTTNELSFVSGPGLFFANPFCADCSGFIFAAPASIYDVTQHFSTNATRLHLASGDRFEDTIYGAFGARVMHGTNGRAITANDAGDFSSVRMVCGRLAPILRVL